MKNTSQQSFAQMIRAFNQMYRMPVADFPTLDAVGDYMQRMRDFKKILTNEINEIDDIIAAAEQGATPLQTLTNLADLFADITVYSCSEMAKFGIPHDEVLSIVMESNFSKMGEDGKPIFDEHNKLQKGPSYWKPEPKIEALLALKGAQ